MQSSVTRQRHRRYRAPECLLTDGYYSYKMDMWGVGCVFFEIVALFPLFPGANEIDQIQKIHNVLGTPSPELLAKFTKRSAQVRCDKRSTHALNVHSFELVLKEYNWSASTTRTLCSRHSCADSVCKRSRRHCSCIFVSTLFAHHAVKLCRRYVLCHANAHVCCKRPVSWQRAVQIDFNFPHKEGTGVAKLVPHCAPDCVSLIERLLVYDPDERLSARQALKHPYFKDLRYVQMSRSFCACCA